MISQQQENRREFLKYLGSLTMSIVLPFGASGKSKGFQDRLGEILPKRKLGNTDESVTMLGLGGYHVGWNAERDAQEVIETALEGGIRFFDSAESYGPHTSEIRYGKYLTPKYRDIVFLMTKTYTQEASVATKHLEESLSRMKTDYLDLWQVHSLESPEDVDTRIMDGILEVMIKAKESGKVRHIGFTGHANPAAHSHMLQKTMENPIFETIQMPINVLDFQYKHSFIRDVLPIALERNMGVLAMKTLADGRFFGSKIQGDKEIWKSKDPVIPDRISIRDALYFAWSMPISVLITGAENKSLLVEKVQLAKDFFQLSEDERQAIVKRVSDLSENTDIEYYKGV